MNLKTLLLLTLILSSILSSCWSSKDARRLYRKNKVIKESDPIIYASRESAVSFVNVALRENYFFDITQNAFWFPDYYAGTWELRNDTFFLRYIDNRTRDGFDYATLNSDSSVLTLISDSSKAEFIVPITYKRNKK